MLQNLSQPVNPTTVLYNISGGSADIHNPKRVIAAGKLRIRSELYLTLICHGFYKYRHINKGCNSSFLIESEKTILHMVSCPSLDVL